MVAITDSDGWVPVTRPEITDIALGGNETNFPGKFFRELASRDQYLYEQALGGDAQSIASAVAFRQLGIAAVAQGRLTLETGVAVSTTDQLAKTVLYYTPYTGDYVALYDTGLSRWDLYQFTETSLSLSGLAANTNYDVFLWNNSGTLTLEAVAWSNSGAGTSTRASAISQLEGIWVKDSDKRRYLGTIRTTATTGQCELSRQNIYVFNSQNRAQRSMLKQMLGIGIYTYTVAAWRAAYNDVTQQIRAVVGLPSFVSVTTGLTAISSPVVTTGGTVAIGHNSTTVNSSQIWCSKPGVADRVMMTAFGNYAVNPGFHYWQILEWGGTDEGFEGDGSLGTGNNFGTSGIFGSIEI